MNPKLKGNASKEKETNSKNCIKSKKQKLQ